MPFATMTFVHPGTSQMHSYPTSSVDHSNMDEEIYANCRIEDLPCYHESVTRNTAEILLLSSAEEGSFLIRPSTNKGNFGVSVRLANSVKHFQIDYNGQWFTFGQAQFWTPLEIWGHLQNGPVLECDEGIVVHLSRPYYNESKIRMPAGNEYSTINRHYVQEERPPHRGVRRSSSNIILSKEGQLYKKKEGKNWRRRWFILNKNFLSFKKNEREKKARKVLDLGTAIQAHEHLDNTRENCFRILFRNDSYILSADSPEDRNLWLSSIKWQIEAAQHDK